MDEVSRSFGPHVWLLYVVLCGVSAAAWWLAQNILIPVRDDHREFLKELRGSIKDISSTQHDLADTATVISSKIDTLGCRPQPRNSGIQPQ
jgi:hypothetical protein